MAKVFVSYSRKDIEFAKKLTGELQKGDLDFWIDWEGIPPTVDWWREIEKGIEEADVFLFLISPDSAKSQICGKEIDTAVKNGKRIIPIVVREIEWEDTPPQLGHLNYIFFSRNDDFNTAVMKLMTAIQTDYEWAATHRRLQVKALEWERINKENSFLLRGKDLQDAELQLATNSSKEPHPTDLQREYVFGSRKATDRQRRITTGISIAAAIALAALAVFGFYEAKVATDKARIALARQLAAQAESINASRNSRQMTAVLLAVQSMKIDPSSEASQLLLNNNFAAHPIARMTHGEYVNTVAFSPDGKYVASGGCDKTDANSDCTKGSIYIWEASTGMEVAHMTHDGAVLALAFSPDGKYVASGSEDKTARVWEASTGREVAGTTHAEYVNTVAFSPDSKYVVSGSGRLFSGTKGTARVWEALTGKEVSHVAYDDAVLAVAFSPDGKYVVSGSADTTARVWEAASGEEVARMTHDDVVSSVAFSPDGKYVVSGSYDRTAGVWEAATGKEVARMTHDELVSSVAFSPDGKYVVSGSSDGTARVWEAATGKELARMTHDVVKLSGVSVAFSPDGKYVVSGSSDGTARVWEAATGKELARMTHDGEVRSVAFSPDGKYVVSGSLDGTARVWEAPTQEAVASTNQNNDYLAFSPDGKYGVAVNADGTVSVREVATSKEIARMAIPNDLMIQSFALSPDGKYVVAVNVEDGSPHMWEVATGKEIAHKNSGYVPSVAFSPDGKYVVSGSSDNTVRVWEAATGEEIAVMTHNNSVNKVAFSPDGKYVVSGSDDNTARVWEVASEKEVARMTHDGIVYQVAFSPDGKYVVSGSDDHSARVWQATTGKEVTRITYDGSGSLVFSPDGKFVIVRDDYSGASRRWVWQPNDVILNACAYIPRNLTRAEWQLYIGDVLPYQAVCDNLPIEAEVTATPTEASDAVPADTSLPVTEPPGATEVPATEAPAIATEAISTEAPAATEAAIPAAQSAFTEEFDGNLDSWSTFMTSGEGSQVHRAVEKGSLKIELLQSENRTPWFYMVKDDFTYTDIQVEAVMTNNGNNANGVSLICRYTDKGWYEFTVSNAGLYSISAFDINLLPLEGHVPLATGGSSAIKTGPTTNVITATCKGHELTLSVNGRLLKTVKDTLYNFTEGKIGIAVSSPRNLPVDIQFESLSVSRPE